MQVLGGVPTLCRNLRSVLDVMFHHADLQTCNTKLPVSKGLLSLWFLLLSNNISKERLLTSHISHFDDNYLLNQISCFCLFLAMTQIPEACNGSLTLLSALLCVQLSTPPAGTLPALPASSPSSTTAAGITDASQMQISPDCPGVPPHRTMTKTARRDTV